ncbi:hypothetical protein [Streptomyces sp. NPDC001268]|uniref:hypothetical protein n=1 Tax=Streptomyces sp. NPDC001268 TaxID=3364553 RepID=UPI00367C1495
MLSLIALLETGRDHPSRPPPTVDLHTAREIAGHGITAHRRSVHSENFSGFSVRQQVIRVRDSIWQRTDGLTLHEGGHLLGVVEANAALISVDSAHVLLKRVAHLPAPRMQRQPHCLGHL